MMHHPGLVRHLRAQGTPKPIFDKLAKAIIDTVNDPASSRSSTTLAPIAAVEIGGRLRPVH